jgi:hypothetical protein
MSIIRETKANGKGKRRLPLSVYLTQRIVSRSLDDLDRVRADPTKGLSFPAADYVLRQEWVTPWEHEFLLGTAHLEDMDLSERQRAVRARINAKVLDRIAVMDAEDQCHAF